LDMEIYVRVPVRSNIARRQESMDCMVFKRRVLLMHYGALLVASFITIDNPLQ